MISLTINSATTTVLTQAVPAKLEGEAAMVVLLAFFRRRHVNTLATVGSCVCVCVCMLEVLLSFLIGVRFASVRRLLLWLIWFYWFSGLRVWIAFVREQASEAITRSNTLLSRGPPNATSVLFLSLSHTHTLITDLPSMFAIKLQSSR